MSLKNKPLLFSASIFLSLIGSSLALIAYLLAAFFYEKASALIVSMTNSFSMNGTSPTYFAILGGLYGTSLVGVILMWNWKKAGFFVYAFPQLAILFLPICYLGENSFSVMNTIFTLMFILIYLSFYKRMGTSDYR